MAHHCIQCGKWCARSRELAIHLRDEHPQVLLPGVDKMMRLQRALVARTHALSVIFPGVDSMAAPSCFNAPPSCRAFRTLLIPRRSTNLDKMLGGLVIHRLHIPGLAICVSSDSPLVPPHPPHARASTDYSSFRSSSLLSRG